MAALWLAGGQRGPHLCVCVCVCLCVCVCVPVHMTHTHTHARHSVFGEANLVTVMEGLGNEVNVNVPDTLALAAWQRDDALLVLVVHIRERSAWPWGEGNWGGGHRGLSRGWEQPAKET